MNFFRISGNHHPQNSKKNKFRRRTMFSEEPALSSRNAALEIGMHHTTIWRSRREALKLSPYKLQVREQLNDEDKTQTIDFAQYCSNELRNDSKFLKRNFSDECKFAMS